MAHRSSDVAVARSGGAGSPAAEAAQKDAARLSEDEADSDLPQCKIKRNYSCNLCTFFSQNPRSFLYHSRDVHFDRIKIYECSQCLYASKHSQKLQRHINMIHVAGKSRVKKVAKKPERKKEVKPKPVAVRGVDIADIGTIGTVGNMVDIVVAKSRTNAVGLENKVKLPMEGVEESLIEGEIVREAEGDDELVDGELRCSFCNFTSRSPMLMRRHEKVVHLKKRFLRCNKCAYVTHVKARFTKHVKYHSMPMIKCDLCDFRTPYKWNLDRHYKNHCGTGAFQCSKCNFRADIKQSLTVHEMNHHVPPVGQGAVMARKKNKVGASETTALEAECVDHDELELLRLEREDAEAVRLQVAGKTEGKRKTAPTANDASVVKKTAKSTDLSLTVRSSYNAKRESNKELQPDFIHPDDIVPRYGQIYVKNLKCKLCSYKAVFNHEIWRHEKRIHGLTRPEQRQKAPIRPPPKLIPIQNKLSPTPPTSPILKIPKVQSKRSASPGSGGSCPPVSVNDSEFNEMCKKSCLTSSLKDFVSLIGDEEALKNIPDPLCDVETLYKDSPDEEESSSETNDSVRKKQTDSLKRKNASFFDKLKEKLLTGAGEEGELVCETCGHQSKCLSESLAHLKRHHREDDASDGPGDLGDPELGEAGEAGEPEGGPAGSELSSTRCQHCRQRCKTSTDLVNHLKVCKALEVKLEDSHEDDSALEDGRKSTDEEASEDVSGMENRVFVWNKMPQDEDEMEEAEVVVGYGAVTTKGSDNTESGTLVAEVDPRLSLTVKKVFKCPHCAFWASTASRFHVHIVGHLNKKPFECSLCLYRSNWRWDITKHIRLKSARDPRHLQAQVNMTDETGRRNYSKYNKYLTMMKVHEPSAESSGTGRRSRPCDATQGTVSEKDVIRPARTLPAPPRLTRAPVPGAAHHIPQGAPLRPPPPLKAAHHVTSPSRPVAQPPLLHKGHKAEARKTLWKCKKCNYRDSSKAQVLSHVKEHYGKRKGERPGRAALATEVPAAPPAEGVTPSASSPASGEEADDAGLQPSRSASFRCGHCQQRHCRLKHNGDVKVKVGWDEGVTSEDATALSPSLDIAEEFEDPKDVISCDICPFTTETEGDLTAHKLNHVDRPGSIFKCTFCPFYVPSKIAVLEHLEVHGVDHVGEVATTPIDNFDPRECTDEFNLTIGGAGKRYKCKQCPYVSNSRTQFLYHKQFHRPRNAPFRCMYCSYNVTRRHLLHQHLRVHQMNNDAPLKDQPEMNTIDMPEIPLVWVERSGGDLVKMFKCRWCPHVNLRKVNIQEHEKMHRGEKKSRKDRAGSAQFRLQCSDCSYMCNNPGVLSSHVKVHQGLFGEIRSLVDPTRSDAEQMKYLQNSSRITEPEVVIKVEHESDVELSQDSQPQLTHLAHMAQPRLRLEEEAQPESSYNQTHTVDSEDDAKSRLLSFCNKCPARFFYKKELRIHAKFHLIRLPFRCPFCTYTARQRPHLLAHYKVHSQDYQEKTAGLVDSYVVCSDFPQPKTAMVTKESQVMEGPVWMVVSQENLIGKAKDSKRGEPGPYKPLAKHACHLCPAKFFKTVALQYHLTLHGGSHQHKCKYCDYTVKTYGNLIKHQLVHEDGRRKVGAPAQVQVAEGGKEEAARRGDPQFGALMHGHPDFIYPTYLKNGKVKEKRYKCHKCPSAFEKRDQYRIHLSLHGSRQKYKCEKCDYSVKYYANYTQHMRKHQNHDEAIEARKSDVFGSMEIKLEPPPSPRGGLDELPGKRDMGDQEVYELTMVEQQTLMLQERRKLSVESEDRKCFCCPYCPYTSHRRDAVDSHTRRHYCVTGVRSAFECIHCDYTACQSNFLREHSKLHFGKPRHRAEGFLKCDGVELWCVEERAKEESRPSSDNRILVFKDNGEELEEKERFVPAVPELAPGAEEEEDEWRMYVNPETGEPLEEVEELEEVDESEDQVELGEGGGDPLALSRTNSPAGSDLIEMVEESGDEEGTVTTPLPTLMSRPRRRLRGKNWKCRKCPHAFGKKDQFQRHIALHGSNQRHQCDICDYSVKFYTNYVQHMRMHQMHEPERVIFVKKNMHTAEEYILPAEAAAIHYSEESTQTSTDYLQFEPEVIIAGDDEDGPALGAALVVAQFSLGATLDCQHGVQTEPVQDIPQTDVTFEHDQLE